MSGGIQKMIELMERDEVAKLSAKSAKKPKKSKLTPEEKAARELKREQDRIEREFKQKTDALTREMNEAEKIRKELLKGKKNTTGLWSVMETPYFEQTSQEYYVLSGAYFDVVEWVIAGKCPKVNRFEATIEEVHITPVPTGFHVDMEKLTVERKDLIERLRQIDISIRAKQ
jgi:hypothetical protein